MKKFWMFLAVGTALVMAQPASAKFKRIKTASDFSKLVVGKTLIASDGAVTIITADGKFTGRSSEGDKYYGAWVWNKKFWCRNVVWKGKERGTDCQVFEVDGTAFRGTRKKGKGGTYQGVIK